ncbi:acetyl-CoA synthetase-like protein [Fistulina hepatica ATCC 64428]|uniref:Acetyl-CoA synthetase-like protein n=1 Tax=Fistulina hepatica ATCC 64428 TaxID=1128425 RepID=A0A0D7A2N8_9AGAR|nr:acetyl-CoA synthetase-like protein [Fistulina hepatica ATCC 64428]
MPPIPNLDVLRKAYKAAPLDGSLSVPQIYDWHREHNTRHPVFLYHIVEGGIGENEVLTYGHLVPAAYEAGRYVSRLTGVPIDPGVKSKPVIAVMAMSDSITFFTTVLGMMRAGFVVYLISPRNSPVAIAYLLSVKQARHFLLSSEPHIQQLGRDAVEELKNGKGMEVGMFPMPRFEDLYHCAPAAVPPEGPSAFDPLPGRVDRPDDVMIIVHSSGSTAFPKLVPWSSRMQVQTARAAACSPFDWRAEVLSIHSLPMFHIAGLSVCAWSIFFSFGSILAVFHPAVPAIIPTPGTTYQGMVDTGATSGFTMPSNLEIWTKDPAKVDHMRRMRTVIYASAPLQKDVGDHLVHAGVNLYNIYGFLQLGKSYLLFLTLRFLGHDWQYFTLNAICKDAVRFKSLDDGTYELITLKTPSYEAALSNSLYEGHEAYATEDVVEPHPTREGLWRVVGRLDDQIMLSTGEKVRSILTTESILRGHPMVKDSIMFGRGHFQNGILVAPDNEYKFDPQDTEKLHAFREAIWPIVEKMNAYAPSHSRLAKEMILVEDPKRPFQFNPKGAPRRSVVLAEYDTDIEALYAAVEASSTPDINAPTQWTPESTYDFVKQLVHSVMRLKVDAEQDFFQYGCDSLQATWIRNAIMKALHSAKVLPQDTELPSNIIYEYPTLDSLAKVVLQVASLKPCETVKVFDEKALLAFVGRYTAELPKEVVLLTGSTGSLGSVMLARLVAMDSVGKIYAFNLPMSTKTVDIQRKSLKLRGYDENIAMSPKIVYVDGTLTVDGMNMRNKSLEDEIRSSITHIIHNAWRVDWKVSLNTFQDCVDGVLGLTKFALSSPRQIAPRLLFVSSIAVLLSDSFLADYHGEAALELPVVDPKIPLGQGYGEGKWAAETILNAARERTRLRPIIVRIGQISGGVNGGWNQSDWVPAIVKSSVTLGCFPMLKGVCSWLGVEDVAGALIDARNSEHSTLHLIHHRPMAWDVLAQVCAKELSLRLVPYPEWFAKLKTSVEHEVDAARRKALPAGMLLEFLEANLRRKDTEGVETFGFKHISVDKMLEVSHTLREAKPIGADDVRLWLSFWKSTGFL